MILTLHDLTSNFDHKLKTDFLLLDFSKAFDSVPHQRLLLKLASYGICGQTLTWIKSFLSDSTQTNVVGGCQSEVCSVTSGVPQGSVLRSLPFLIYINDLPDNISSQIRLFADDCIIYLGLSSSTQQRYTKSIIQSRVLYSACIVRLNRPLGVEASQSSLMGTPPWKLQFYQGSPRRQSSVPSCFSYTLTT